MRKNFKTPLVAALFLSAAVVPVNRAYAAEDSSVATMTDAQAPSANPAPAASEKRTVTGVVSDANDGEPLIGATVQIEGDKTAITTTDIDGKFTLTFAPKKDATILITYIGYKA
ncbi:MAG: carboxypeptidase-like regulatory domain-containing protein, partial [Muribaculaceae bacterium]|nr:carboxypeptidase-like regulatory domain-containing protein [Muribaculaceae bacterium]